MQQEEEEAQRPRGLGLRRWQSEALAPLRRRKMPELALVLAALGVDLKEATASAQGRNGTFAARSLPSRPAYCRSTAQPTLKVGTASWHSFSCAGAAYIES